MKKLKGFIAESVSPEDFYNRDWEGHVVEEIVRLLNGKASYRIVLNAELLCRAIKTASRCESNGNFLFVQQVELHARQSQLFIEVSTSHRV